MVLVVAVIGRSGSGKTVTIEYLIKQFSVEGYRVGAVKHIHHRGFTVDTEGKNTWRYAKAGAKVIVAISPDETAIIKKTSSEVGRFDDVLEMLKKEDSLDIVFVEGYHELVAKRVDVVKIVVAKDDKGLQELLAESEDSVVAVSGLIAENLNASVIHGFPVIRIPKDGEKLVELIKHQLNMQKGS
ncbi:MAG: molybdopterin-guanine dinucleotide biosynthesis protein B [Nitrososphaerota archaeon]|nr:molybdopterin-guanine dinucleotide biosynthesis protein B [Nitrososphaerota archaeon]